jgi:hypothetical protein
MTISILESAAAIVRLLNIKINSVVALTLNNIKYNNLRKKLSEWLKAYVFYLLKLR